MILVALGANLPSEIGSPRDTLLAALRAMEEKGLNPVSVSRIWLTAPVPVSNQPWFHNAVAAIDTRLDAKTVLATLHEIEAEFGRVRRVQNEARVLDLDLLVYHDEVVNTPEITLPHPRMHDRAFVLMPLQDVAQDWQHPARSETLKEMIAAIPEDQKAEPEKNG